MNTHDNATPAEYRFRLTGLAVLLGLGPACALAQDDNRFYLAPMASYVLSDKDRDADDALGGTLAAGVRLSRSAEFELRGAFLKYKGEDDTGSSRIEGGGFGVNLFFKGPGGPYAHLDVMGGDQTLFNIGLGWDFLFSDAFGIRAEALYHAQSNSSDDAHDEYKEPLFNLGVRIPFGRAPEPPPPRTPALAAAPPPPPPVCSDGMDNDGDGLVDFPADRGCRSADDGDETDPAPRCAPPIPGQAISLEGCGVGDVIVLRGVNFDFDQDSLTLNARHILDTVAVALDSRPDVKVEIGGHTDGKGSDSYNAALSDRRSRTVRDYLVAKGISAARLSTKGYGESVPVASNDTDQGRELNRRVELKLIESAATAPATPASATALPSAAPMAPPADAVVEAPAEPTEPAATVADGMSVVIDNFAFAPASLTVPVGTTVTWTNQDGSNHFVKFADAGSERLKHGAVYTRSFTAAGRYPYQCSLHSAMSGVVIVQ